MRLSRFITSSEDIAQGVVEFLENFWHKFGWEGFTLTAADCKLIGVAVADAALRLKAERPRHPACAFAPLAQWAMC